MSNGKINALVIISLIIGASGLGIGVFSVLRFQVVEGPQGDPGADGTDGTDGVDGLDGINGTLNNLIGVWETIEGGPSTIFNLNFSENVVNESEFFTLDQGYNLTLIKPGWYRINIRFLWRDLISTTGCGYSFLIVKNESYEYALEQIYLPPHITYLVDTYTYVYSDGNDHFHFTCLNWGITDETYISSSQSYNQFVLEYVKEA
ncbi:MAG: hypothetical protein JW776_01425 [Candidatus Lokiarchaeota archaeon]|nr:hypothetical protein [Candidatus Lokiarchaeota archaeon]